MIRSVTDTALIWFLVTSCLVRAFNTVHSGCSPANHTVLRPPLPPRVAPADPFWGNCNIFRFLYRGDPQLAATFDQCFPSIRVGRPKNFDAPYRTGRKVAKLPLRVFLTCSRCGRYSFEGSWSYRRAENELSACTDQRPIPWPLFMYVYFFL